VEGEEDEEQYPRVRETHECFQAIRFQNQNQGNNK
jgi:hypothetical protein